jgi:hypothetical protein
VKLHAVAKRNRIGYEERKDWQTSQNVNPEVAKVPILPSKH